MKAYSSANNILLVNGVEIVGFDAGDDVIKGARTKDSASSKVGVDGEMSVSHTQDKSGTVTIRLMSTSDSNAYLRSVINAAENGAFVPVNVMFKDTANSQIAGGTRGFITRHPDISRGENVTSQEWVIGVERYDVIETFIDA